MYVPGAIAIAFFNTLTNSLNSLMFTIAGSNPTYLPPWSMYIGPALYTVGILIEPIAEVQRAIFKAKPENKGKPYAGGLFSLARNINYGGYTLWRSGMAFAAGGPLWGGLMFGLLTWDFATRGIPVLEEYLRSRYGDEYKRIEKEVPYKLFPGIY